jgi:hypothetical protein
MAEGDQQQHTAKAEAGEQRKAAAERGEFTRMQPPSKPSEEKRHQQSVSNKVIEAQSTAPHKPVPPADQKE